MDPTPSGRSPMNADGLSNEALLRRIAASVERDGRRGRLEVATAVILSLATLCSTWCAYQSTQWSGVQSGSQAAADTAERRAAEDTILGFQIRTFDGIVLIEYWRAMRAEDAKTSETIFAHMRPSLQAAVRASLAAGILEDPRVAGPLQRPEYVLEQEQQARRLRDEAAKLNAEAKRAGREAGRYVVLTLMFASVLFFGGITGTFGARRVRIALSCVALALFLVTVVGLLSLPVCGAGEGSPGPEPGAVNEIPL